MVKSYRKNILIIKSCSIDTSLGTLLGEKMTAEFMLGLLPE